MSSSVDRHKRPLAFFGMRSLLATLPRSLSRWRAVKLGPNAARSTCANLSGEFGTNTSQPQMKLSHCNARILLTEL